MKYYVCRLSFISFLYFFNYFFLFLSLTLKIFKIEYFSKLSKQYIFFTIVSWFICQIKMFHTYFKSYFHIYSVNLMLFTIFSSLNFKIFNLEYFYERTLPSCIFQNLQRSSKGIILFLVYLFILLCF